MKTKFKAGKLHIQLATVRNPHGIEPHDVKSATLDLCKVAEEAVQLIKIINEKYGDTYYPLRGSMFDNKRSVGDLIDKFLEKVE